MNYDIKEITSVFFNTNEIVGDVDHVVNNASNLDSCNHESLVFCTYDDLAKVSAIQAGIVLAKLSLKNDITDFKSKCIVFCESPKFTFLKVLENLCDDSFTDEHYIIEDKSIRISKNAYVENGATIGSNSLIYPNTSIFKCASIGSNTIIQSSTVIGGNGLGDVLQDGKFHKFTHLGGVVIEDDVHIGCNVTVLRGMLENTRIGKGTRIANHVNVGHNAIIEEDVYISAGVTIGGASVIKKGAWIAPGVSLIDHITVGENTMIGTGATVVKDALPNSVYFGSPAKHIRNRK